MARGNNTSVFSGPWIGMEERDTYQTDGHCKLALNVDFSRGYIEGRDGLVKTEVNVPARSRMFVHRRDGVPRYIICVGPGSKTGEQAIKFNALNLEGDAISDTVQDLTDSFGEPKDKDFDCSFVSVIVTRPDPATGKKTIPRHVTLVSTRHNSYLYDPLDNESELVAVDMTKDPIQLNDLNWGYWNIRPRGHIATEHQSRVYYAGFSEGFQTELTSPLDDWQKLVPEMLIDQSDRSKIGFGPQFVVWSDEFDPTGIVAYHFLSVEEHEVITGLKSFQEQLVIFTDRSVYVKTGGTDETFAVHKVASDVGCVSHHSIIEVGGVLLFMAKDGIYAFTGAGQEGAVQKLTKSVDSIFNGRHTNTYIPEKMRAFLYDRGWPFTVKNSKMSRSEALHIQSRNQVWWSLDIEKTPDESWALTLVFDYHHQAWSLYTNGAMTGAQEESFMYSGVSFSPNGGDESVLVSSSAPGIFKYSGETDIGVSSVESNIPMMFISGRLFKENNMVTMYRPLRVKMLSNGDSTKMVNSPFWMVYGEEAHGDSQFAAGSGTVSDAASADRQYTEGKLTMHPAEGMNFFYGVGKWGDVSPGKFAWQNVDWFTSKIESASVRSRSLQIAFFSGHHRTIPLRAPELTIRGFAVEVVTGDTR